MFEIYWIVGVVWVGIMLAVMFLHNVITGEETSPVMARILLAGFVWPLSTVGFVIFGLYYAVKLAWPEQWKRKPKNSGRKVDTDW